MFQEQQPQLVIEECNAEKRVCVIFCVFDAALPSQWMAAYEPEERGVELPRKEDALLRRGRELRRASR